MRARASCCARIRRSRRTAAQARSRPRRATPASSARAVSSGAPRSVAVPRLRWRAAGAAPKRLGEMRLAGEADGERDLAQRERAAEQELGALDPAREHEAVGRRFDLRLEQLRESERAHVELAGKRRNAE